MQIAITGGNGRIGRAVVQLALAQGHSVVSIDRVAAEATPPGGAFIQADLTDYEAVARALRGCQALVHLAAITGPGRHPDHVVHNNNVVSSYNALCAAAQTGIRRVCQASSINAVGAVFSRRPRYDYFPLDERHPTYNEDPYSLSKWICEQQADSVARRVAGMTIASLRLHGVAAVPRRPQERGGMAAKQLWGYTGLAAAARACLLAVTAETVGAAFTGHEIFYIVAPETVIDAPSLELWQEFYPHVPVCGDLSGNRGFFNCEKAERLLGWRHEG
jgi:nucleoside-diphosphate-sugar epimerase